jgi:hypothetical protein
LGQLKEDLKKAQTDRAAAKTAIAEATAIREKEAAEFATLSSELKTNIAAIGKAVAAWEFGVRICIPIQSSRWHLLQILISIQGICLCLAPNQAVSSSWMIAMNSCLSG